VEALTEEQLIREGILKRKQQKSITKNNTPPRKTPNIKGSNVFFVFKF
jgi:hypothetical protein